MRKSEGGLFVEKVLSSSLDLWSVSGDWISGSIQSRQSIWSREAGNLSSREAQGLGGSYCSSQHQLLVVSLVAQCKEFLKSIALGFQIFVCYILYIHQRTLLQYRVSTGGYIWHLCFPPWQRLIVIFWQSSHKGPKATVNCVNSQLTLGDIAEWRSACVECAYMVECVEAEKQAGIEKKGIWRRLNREEEERTNKKAKE